MQSPATGMLNCDIILPFYGLEWLDRFLLKNLHSSAKDDGLVDFRNWNLANRYVNIVF